MISETSSFKKSSPPSSAFPTFLYIVLCIILVGWGWEPFLFFMHSLWHKARPHNVYRTTRVAALLLRAQKRVKSRVTELAEFSGLGDNQHPLAHLHSLSAHHIEKAKGQRWGQQGLKARREPKLEEPLPAGSGNLPPYLELSLLGCACVCRLGSGVVLPQTTRE